MYVMCALIAYLDDKASSKYVHIRKSDSPATKGWSRETSASTASKCQRMRTIVPLKENHLAEARLICVDLLVLLVL